MRSEALGMAVCDCDGKVINYGLERTRATAKYEGERALFLLFW